MPKKRAKPPVPRQPRVYWGPDIPMRVIRRFARQVAEKFDPDKIILFGSFAYGTPHKDSDVDILVIKDTWSQHSLAVQIRMAVDAPFPMDLIVRTPKDLKWRLEEGELFHSEIVTKGKVLYEKSDSRMGPKSRRRLRRRSNPRAKSASSA